MNKYLQLLLQLESTVIIPEFGAIIIANEKTGDLLFNEYLKFNDGKLVQFIVENSNMDEQEALNFISKYVREINAQLDKGESYDMFEFGSFTKNKDGKIVFVPWEKIKNVGLAAVQTLADEDKEENVTEETSTEEVETTPQVESQKEISETKEEEIVEEAPKAEDESNKKVNIYIPPTPKEEEKVEEPVQEETVTATIKEEAKPQKSEGIKVATAKKVVTVPPKEEKKKRKFGWLILLILLIGGGTFAFLKREDLKALFNNEPVAEKVDENSEENTTPPAGDAEFIDEENEELPMVPDTLTEEIDTLVNEVAEETIEDETEAIAEEVEEEAQEVMETPAPQNNASTTGKYKMICGNFSELANAEKQVAELKAKGYNAEIIGIFGGLHRVSMNSYASYQDAVNALPAAKEEVSGAYVSRQ